MKHPSMRATLAILLFLGAATKCYALAGSHPPGKLPLVHSDWSQQLLDLVNSDGRVAGSWVNGADYFSYAGDTAAFNTFVKAYSALTETPLSVVIHAGRPSPRAADNEPEFDWSLVSVRRGWGAPLDPARSKDNPGYVVTVHVWLNHQIELERMQIPPNVEVSSGGEIEKFIETRKASAK